MVENLDMFWPNFDKFWPKFGPKNFFCGFYLSEMLCIPASYNCMQCQEKLMNQTWENGKKPSFETNFDLFGSKIWALKIFFMDFTSTTC